MHVSEESDSGIVPMNHSNKDGKPSAESEEGRPLIKENARQPNTHSTQSGKGVSQGLAGVRKAARENKEMKFTALLHHLTVDLLRESFYSLKRKAAPGVDGVTWQEYEPGLEDRLGRSSQPGSPRSLSSAAIEKSVHTESRWTATSTGGCGAGRQGCPTGRGHHPQPDLRGRLSGLLVWVSAGAQPASSAGCVVVRAPAEEGELRSGLPTFEAFSITLDKSWLVKFVEHRVADPRILRLIQKWLKAGVMEEGEWSDTKTGTPQGSVISPLLANIYLHYVFDLWVDVWRKKCAQGEVVVVRYADDIILGFQHQTDADRFLENFRERLGKFGLELHPDKTRRIEFGRFAEHNRKRRGEGKPETFDFLGFTHISGKNGLGRFMVRRKTIRKRMRAKLREIKQQLRKRMHDPVPQTGQWLKSVVQGYFNYYAVPGNLDESGRVSGSGDRALVANDSSPEPETPDLMDAHSRFGSALASSTARAPSLS